MARRPQAEPGAARSVASEGEAAAEALGPEADLIARHDPMSFGRALAQAGAAVATSPVQALQAGLRFTGHLAAAGSHLAGRALGLPAPADLLAPAPKDSRFADPAWETNPWFFAQRQAYLAWSGLMHELATAGDLDRPTADKAAFAVGLIVDALAPTNFLLSNPTALRTAVDTKGLSVLKGVGNLCHDVATNGGWPRQVDETAFEVGRNLACTPGKVVFRNDLMELIQYVPHTETVYSVPLLLSPPWINKYYIMDLAPERSFAEWAVRQGHTVFAISYRNPDETMRDVALDDYLVHGPRRALDVVAEITGSTEANMVGLCLGGTLTVMFLAHLAASGDRRVRSATLLNTLVDFSEPGPLGAFTDPVAIGRLEKRMARKGFLEAADMGNVFNALRANDLIWSYVANSWLMGRNPPAFDILSWNADGTRMPAAMHSFYLRSCYEQNQLARDEMTLAGTPLRLGDIGADIYIVGAVEDHIAPWRSSYASTGLFDGPVRFVLTSSGHIAGIVNPPATKRQYWTQEDLPVDPDAWLAGAAVHDGSWWQDWADWMQTRSGPRRKPPALGSATHPPSADAPGDYVHG